MRVCAGRCVGGWGLKVCVCAVCLRRFSHSWRGLVLSSGGRRRRSWWAKRCTSVITSPTLSSFTSLFTSPQTRHRRTTNASSATDTPGTRRSAKLNLSHTQTDTLPKALPWGGGGRRHGGLFTYCWARLLAVGGIAQPSTISSSANCLIMPWANTLSQC